MSDDPRRFVYLSRHPYPTIPPDGRGYLSRVEHVFMHVFMEGCLDSFDGWLCCRPRHHTGHHAAHVGDAMCAVWTRQEETP